MNFPEQVIRNKMKLDGIAESEQDAFFNPEAAASPKAAAPSAATAKYERMKKMGMPLHAIVNKMRLDGLSADVIAQFENR